MERQVLSGADIEETSLEYGTPLMTAASYGRRNGMYLLSDKGANIEARGGPYDPLDNALHAAIVGAIRTVFVISWSGEP